MVVGDGGCNTHPVSQIPGSRYVVATTTATFLNFCKGFAFRRDGRYFILAERQKSKDTLGVYDAEDNYKQVRVRFIFLGFYHCFLNILRKKAFCTADLQSRFIGFLSQREIHCCLG